MDVLTLHDQAQAWDLRNRAIEPEASLPLVLQAFQYRIARPEPIPSCACGAALNISTPLVCRSCETPAPARTCACGSALTITDPTICRQCRLGA